MSAEDSTSASTKTGDGSELTRPPINRMSADTKNSTIVSTNTGDGVEPSGDALSQKQSKPITKTVQLYADKIDGNVVYYHHYSSYNANGQNRKNAVLCADKAEYDAKKVLVCKDQFFFVVEAPDTVWGAGRPTHFILNVTHAVKSFKKNSVQPVSSSPQSSHDPTEEAFCAESIKQCWLDALQGLFPADLVEEYATSLSNQFVSLSMASTLTDAQLSEMKIRIGHRSNVLAAAARAASSNKISLMLMDALFSKNLISAVVDVPKKPEDVLCDSTSARTRTSELLQDEHLHQLPKPILKTLQLQADEIDSTFVYFHHYSSYNGNGRKRANAIFHFSKAPFDENEVRVHEGQYLLLVTAPGDIKGAGKPTHFILNINHALKIFKKNAPQPEPAQVIADVELWVVATHSKSLMSINYDPSDRLRRRGAPDAAVKLSGPTEANSEAS